MPIDARNMCANNLSIKTICDLSNGTISKDLERTLTLFSRSGHSLTLNISQTATVAVYAADERSACDSYKLL